MIGLESNPARSFNNCFVCDKDIKNSHFAWSCKKCWNIGIISKIVKDVLHNMPTHITRDQHRRYIRRLYFGKVEN